MAVLPKALKADDMKGGDDLPSVSFSLMSRDQQSQPFITDRQSGAGTGHSCYLKFPSSFGGVNEDAHSLNTRARPSLTMKGASRPPLCTLNTVC